jgi:hypothetical protein
MSAIKGVGDRKIILLSTATITEDNIHANGLFQNVFLLYKMFESMGYASILIVNDKPKALKNIPSGLHKCRMIVTEDMLRQPMANVAAMIEIGMSLDPLIRQFVKMIGGRLLKLYLGNILNIDVETPIFISNHYFMHHVVGKNDQILVSPHYGQHAEYASYLNHVTPPENLEDMIAPYVWDSSILTRDGTKQISWKPPATPEDEVFVIMEPNISFQKASIVPLCIIEKWYREKGKARGWGGSVVVVNGDRLGMVPHFRENFMTHLELFKDGKIEMRGRQDIISTLEEFPSATFVLHNYNNEFNYMTLELLSCGFPVLHNAPSWVEFGYGYVEADLAAGVALIEDSRSHADRMETYKAHAATLSWRYSPYNPAIHAAWQRIIENKGSQ